jgi:hypothetical protein
VRECPGLTKEYLHPNEAQYTRIPGTPYSCVLLYVQVEQGKAAVQQWMEELHMAGAWAW